MKRAGAGIGIALVFALLAVPDPGVFGRSALWEYCSDFLHFPLFALLTVALLLLLPKQKGERRIAVALGMASLLAVATEILQPAVGRSGEGIDLALSLAGVVFAGLLIFSTTTRNGAAPVCRVTSVAILGVAVLPALLLAADRAAARNEFPLLGSFESKLELHRWRAHGCHLALARVYVTHGHSCLCIQAGRDSDYSGIFMKEIPGDLSKAQTLVADVFLAGSSPARLWVRADDRLSPAYEDRFQKMMPITPGSNKVLVTLEEFITPSGRRIDLARLKVIGFFLENPTPSQAFYIDAVQAELSAKSPAQ